jgi:subtilisin family serine protease
MRRWFLSALLVVVLLVVLVPSLPTSTVPASDVGSSGYTPAMSVSLGVDENGNRVEDVLEEEIALKNNEGNGTHLVDVVVLLNVVPTFVQTSFFAKCNGTMVEGVWRDALNGFGRISYVAIENFASMCPGLLLVQRDHGYEALVAYAAQQSRARPYVWDLLGYRGDPLSSIAISDTGIDDSHVNHLGYGDADFSEKIVGWRDDVGTSTAPYDDNGHGSNVAGIAAGSGFYSTDAQGRAVTTWSASLGTLSTSYIYLLTGFNVSESGSGQKITLQAKGRYVDELYLYYSGFTGNPSQELVASYGMPVRDQEYTFEYDVPEGKVGYYHLWMHPSSSVRPVYLRVTVH